MKHHFNCSICGKESFRYFSNKPDTKIPKVLCCSSTCRGIWLATFQTGDNNPNFNKRWSEEKRAQQSALVKSLVDDSYRESAGSANRGKVFSPERIEAMHGNRTSESYSRPHSLESKLKIGEKSSQKFKADGYIEKVRYTMEQGGYWFPLETRDAFDIYNDAADWTESMFNYFNEDELQMFHDVGMFNIKTNRRGMVRDHRFSRKDGFDLGVFCEILRHPCNCQLITHSANASKRSKSSITLQDLFVEIRAYSGNWYEQTNTLRMIDAYENGARWSKQYFIEGLNE